MSSQGSSGEREFVGRGMARIFGAPISWIALFGALMGALSIVPMLFYPMGGGFASAGMIIFGPLSGIILGPWAGFVAGFIGGIIGMFISPGAYPLGLVDVFFSGAFIPLFFGLVHPRYRKFFLPLSVVNVLLSYLIPYVIPGPAGGYDPMDWGKWTFAISWALVGWVVYIVGQNFFFRKMDTENIVMRMVWTVLYMLGPTVLWMLPWDWIYYLFLRYPFEMSYVSNVLAWWTFVIPVPLASGIVAALMVRALEQTGLPKVTGSLLDREGF